MRPDAAIGVGGRLDRTDLDMIETGLCAIGGFAAGIGRFQHKGPRALRHAQRLGRQRRDIFAGADIHQRHTPDDAVIIGNPVGGAQPRRRCVEYRQIGQNAGKAMQEGLRIVAGDREAGFLRRLARVAVIDQHGSQHHRQLFDRLGEDGIVVDRAADQQRDLLGLIGPKIFHIAAKRSPVRLGIHNVGRYRGGAGGADFADQFGHHRAGPGPLAENLQRFIVDIDDAHRLFFVIGARRQLLHAVEGNQPQRVDEEGIRDPGDDEQGKDSQHEQRVKQLAAVTKEFHSIHPAYCIDVPSGPAAGWRRIYVRRRRGADPLRLSANFRHSPP